MGRCGGDPRLLPVLMLQSESRVSGDKPSCDEHRTPRSPPSERSRSRTDPHRDVWSREARRCRSATSSGESIDFPSPADVTRRRRAIEPLGASSPSQCSTDGRGGEGVGFDIDSRAMVQSVSRMESRLGLSKLS